MYKEKTICVVVPAYNEEKQITKVIETMPDYVDYMVLVDDCSTDTTSEVIAAYAKKNKKIILIRHEVNQGVGGAIATGYKWARDNGVDAAVVMAGDGQMDPADMPVLLDPVVSGEIDYSKANRLIYSKAYEMVPKVRFWGNTILSLLTKIASGYWHISDSQTGYTVINKLALEVINWDLMYKRYGQPNDLLVRLNVHNFKVRDIPLKPVYNVGEESKLKVRKVAVPIARLLLKSFLWRLKEKYVIRDFHPLVFFYLLSFLGGLGTVFFGVRFFALWIARGVAPEITLLLFMFSFGLALQSLFFAMWMDQEYNKNLR